MNKFKLGVIAGLMMTLPACWLDQENEFIGVKGDLTNSITQQKIAQVPIEIVKCSGGFMSPTQCDSVKTIFTDTNGAFTTQIMAQKGYFYKIGIAYNNICESTPIINQKVFLQKGEINTVNFTAIPYQTLRVEVNTTKEQRNYFVLSLRAIDVGNWFVLDIVSDTSRAKQVIQNTFHFKVFPHRTYQVSKQVCNRAGQMIQDYAYTDCDVKLYPEFFVPNVDTTLIVIE